MSGSVIIKGSKNGITLVLNENEEFSVLKEKVAKKFKDSAKFLGSAKTALAFEGKKLTEEQKDEIIGIIRENTELDIVCLLDNSEDGNAKFLAAIEKKMDEKAASSACIHKGSLRSGQSLESETGLVVLGDVNPGASLLAKGNIIVLGSLRGTAWAGCEGNSKCFVIATDMTPTQIRIADIIARAPDNKNRKDVKDIKIAYLNENNAVCIDPLSKDIIGTLVI